MKPFFSVLAALTFLTVSCKKAAIRDVEKASKKLVGSWNVKKIEVRTTDTSGNLVQDTSYEDQGTVLFAYGDKNALGGGYFDHADFTGACALSDLVLYFRSIAAGDAIANGWSLSWDADPDDLRVQFWGITAGGSYHNSVNHSISGNTQKLWYVKQLTYQNKRIFYTWTLNK